MPTKQVYWLVVACCLVAFFRAPAATTTQAGMVQRRDVCVSSPCVLVATPAPHTIVLVFVNGILQQEGSPDYVLARNAVTVPSGEMVSTIQVLYWSVS